MLQITKIRNVTAPKDHEESQAAPQMLKLTLTDGHSTCVSLQLEDIKKLRYEDIKFSENTTRNFASG